MELEIVVVLLFSIFSLIFSLISCLFTISTYIKLRIFTESTQTIPVSQPSSLTDLMEALSPADDLGHPSSHTFPKGRPKKPKEEDGPFLKLKPEDLV